MRCFSPDFHTNKVESTNRLTVGVVLSQIQLKAINFRSVFHVAFSHLRSTPLETCYRSAALLYFEFLSRVPRWVFYFS